MAKVRDRTDDFRDAVRRIAISLNRTVPKIANIMASFIMHKPHERTGFMKATLKTLERIGALEQFLVKHKNDYVDLRHTTEQERDSIEHEVTIFTKSCKEQIDLLKNLINDEEANSTRWLGIRCDNVNADTTAHKHGVVLILSKKLHSVTSEFDKLRALRFQDAINTATPRKKFKHSRMENLPKISKSGNAIPSKTYVEEARESDGLENHPGKVQVQSLDDETRALWLSILRNFDAGRLLKCSQLII